MIINVRQIIRNKGTDIWSVSPDTLIIEALKLMADKGIGAVLVLEDGEIAGIFSERDYARKVILLDRSSRTSPVSEVMTDKVICVGPDATAEQCLVLMTEKRIRHLPILENDKLIALISIGDVVKAVISEQELLIEQLTDYITS